MKLKLDFNYEGFEPLISIKDPIILLGSCFSESIGHKMSDSKFDVTINPFGTIYNPISIFDLIEASINQTPHPLIKHNNQHFSWWAHAELKNSSREKLQEIITNQSTTLKSKLATAKWLFITPGTAWAYVHKESSTLVANCHKISQRNFKKILIDSQEIVQRFEQTYQQLLSVNKNLQIVFTVSPVRHIKDGLIENNRSKSILLQAIHQVVDRFQNCHYFPSYEIQIDELRDYRFYKEDLIHPSDQAVEYIWNSFKEKIVDQEDQLLIGKWEKIQQSLRHRPFDSTSLDYQNFISKTLEKLQQLEGKINVKDEIADLKRRI